jgi:LmbE family N-acetylglucosaminyl deacetylase
MLGGLSPDRTANLGYFDGTLAAMRAHREVAVTSLESGADTLAEFRQGPAPELIPERADGRATWANLVSDLEYVVEHVKPDLIVTPYPLLDAHPDHQLTTIALIEALRDLRWNQGTLLLYTNHSPGSPRYPFGAAGELVGLPPADSAPVFDGLVSNPLNREEQGRKYLALDAMIDIRAEIPPASLAGSVRFLTTALRKKLYGDDESYYRRAVRANEMFLELRVSSLSQAGVLERLQGPLAPQPTTP